MKKLLSSAICAVMLVLMIAVGIPTAARTGFYQTAELLDIKEHIEDDAGMNEYATVQGACTDGAYAYYAVQQGSTVILKYNMKTWELAAKSKKLNSLGHANDMAYNSRENFIVSANNYANNDIVTFIDPKSLKVIGTAQPKREKTEKEIKKEAEEREIEEDQVDKYKRININSIAYNADTDQYIAGISGTYDFAILNTDFEMVERFDGVSTGYTRQGCDCDENYIYFSQSGGDNAVVVYDYTGKYVALVSLGHSHEVENLFHVNKSFFTTLHYYGNSVQRVGLSTTTQIRYRVYYRPGDGYGEMKYTSVHYGHLTELRENTFKKTGYFFGGWRAKRSFDGKYLGYRKFSQLRDWLDQDEVYEYSLYTDREAVSETVKFGSVIMTPFWIREAYVVRYDAGGAEGWMPEATVNYYDAYTIPQNGFDLPGYIFAGFTAYRDYDNKYYGYRKGSKTAEWLESEDLDKAFEFKPGDAFSRMTYDGAVTLTPVFRFAYSFNEDGSALTEYIGGDEVVNIPNPSGKLNTIASGAFSDNVIFTEIHVPETVETVEADAISDCSLLQKIIFKDNFPDEYSDDAVTRCKSPVICVEHDGKRYPVGYAAGRIDAQIMRLNAGVFRMAMSGQGPKE